MTEADRLKKKLWARSYMQTPKGRLKVYETNVKYWTKKYLEALKELGIVPDASITE